jgi:hypothetical protein
MYKSLYPLVVSEAEYRDPSLKIYEVAALVIKRQRAELEALRRENHKLSLTDSVGANTRWIDLEGS